MTKQEKLEKLNLEMNESCLCELKATAKNPVPGFGNANAEIMFIGEAPGKTEDEQGLPFVGAAGKFLDTMLASVNLKREDVYITNVVKYRPPNNRDPFPEEVEACFPWLRAQVELIDPTLIVLLGRHALMRFLPKLRISEVHGKIVHAKVLGLGPRTYFPLYHPAVALYQGNSRDLLLEDFSKIPEILQKEKPARELRENTEKM
ncbi:MAG TPA: uracil-DNA glycosylase [Candidatus Paceibacterota bacterium]|nr:uracil-DNA glycosylase [Candidatus Paceibacterota bacterium]